MKGRTLFSLHVNLNSVNPLKTSVILKGRLAKISILK